MSKLPWLGPSQTLDWAPPDWKDINNPDTGYAGFLNGDGLSAENAKNLDAFIGEFAGGLNLWTGPIKWQDGTDFLKDGEKATPQQNVLVCSSIG